MLQVFDRPLPGATASQSRVNNQRLVGQGIDVAVTAHRVTRVEASFWIERRHQHQAPLLQPNTVLPVNAGLEQVTRKNADAIPTSLGRALHGRGIYAARTARNHSKALVGTLRGNAPGE